jgi:hypothetical protein
MRLDNRPSDDSRFDEAWRAYVNEDAGLQAPPGLESRVWNELAAPPRPKRAYWTSRLLLAVSAAAMIVVTFVALRDESGRPPIPSSPIGVEAIAPPAEPAMIPAFDRTREVERVTPERRTLRRGLPPVLMTLGAGPVRDTEVLQLVRLRLPREALQTLGVALLEPDAGGVVDVDVLIGDDGVARDIRQVRTGHEQETEPPW